MDSLELDYMNPHVNVDRDYVIIIPTYSDTITNAVIEFINHGDNLKHLKGVVGSGDKNFNNDYIFSAKNVVKKFKAPLLFDFEKSGSDKDIEDFRRKCKEIEVS